MLCFSTKQSNEIICSNLCTFVQTTSSMTTHEKTALFIDALKNSLTSQTFVKLTLSNYKGNEENLKNIYLKKIKLKEVEKMSFTFRYKTRDIAKNFDIETSISLINENLNNGFKAATLYTTEFDVFYENQNNQRFIIKKTKATFDKLPSLDHDRTKNRLISSNQKPYLTELKITDQNGNVLANGQDKYKQINKYIEILSALIKEIPEQSILKIVDMGSGKGYLTFALYDYLTHVAKIKSEITGVEYREDLVALCNKIAVNSGFQNLSFKRGSINQFDSTGIHILIALHACDTATDDAIAKGINAGALLIVVAPCCHKQIRREIEAHKKSNPIDYITRHGIFLERQCEMVTDSIRALILEYYGYQTKVFEFISDAHTPKNVMIVGVKTKKKVQKDAILNQIQEAKDYFGIQTHYLEQLLKI